LGHTRDMIAYGGNRNGDMVECKVHEGCCGQQEWAQHQGWQHTAAEQQTPQVWWHTSIKKLARKEDELSCLRFKLKMLQDWHGGRPICHGGH